MTKKEIEKGAGLLLAAVSGCEQMVELLRAAVHYCYEQEKTAKNLTPKGYAGFTRIHHIWTVGIPDVPKLFMGSPIQDRDMARGTLMALFLSTTVFPAETIQIPVYTRLHSHTILPALPHPCAAMDSPLRCSCRDIPCGAITPYEVWNLNCREGK